MIPKDLTSRSAVAIVGTTSFIIPPEVQVVAPVVSSVADYGHSFAQARRGPR